MGYRTQENVIEIEGIQLQPRSSAATELASVWADGLPPQQIGIYRAKVAATTSAEVDSAARKYFPASKMAIVAVGEESVIRDALEPFGIPVQVLQ